MQSCVILGGTGYIGWRWAQRLARTGRFDRIVVADRKPPQGPLPPGVEFATCDVRKPLGAQLPPLQPEWIFNFAAVHREPGHERLEYFETNLPGARQAIEYAEAVGCSRMLFTSSIAVYGPTSGPTDEQSPTTPTSAYGISKLTAEWMQRTWQAASPGRRLLICRPGVIYGPNDPGNILRMVRAVKKGYFFFPGSRNLLKSYGYIEGLLDSFEFVMQGPAPQLTYNYVERETEPLGRLVELVQAHLGKRVPTFAVPLPLLQMAAALVQVATRGRSAIHPARVRKVATSTHIVPRVLVAAGFEFRYDFGRSLKDWSAAAPEDFR
ncbi:MAG TPA: NAD(P)-dependent oxidoreductase [Candidatus Limnocylindria bacterium]|nr:NAD(P)-dependent oxidoreductase [Candidatus Limnocylindria bacterium]